MGREARANYRAQQKAAGVKVTPQPKQDKPKRGKMLIPPGVAGLLGFVAAVTAQDTNRFLNHKLRLRNRR